MTQSCLVSFTRRPRPARRIVCLPWAGGSIQPFRRLAAFVPEDVDVSAIVLPGRDHLVAEPPLRDVYQLAERVARELTVFDVPTTVFGHSLGALVGYEACRLVDHPPARLVVSAYPAPHLPRRVPDIRDASEETLLAELERYGQLPAALRSSHEYREMFVRLVRADFAAAETYRFGAGPPLGCELLAFVGDRDPSATPDEMAEWQHHTAGAFRVVIFPGRHDYWLDQPSDVASRLLGS